MLLLTTIMTKVRVDVYLNLDIFGKIEAIRKQTHHKGYTHIMNKLLSEYFKMEQEIQDYKSMFAWREKEYKEKIKNLEYELKHKQKPIKRTEENIEKAEKILKEVTKND
jgi:hypothetical protein